MISAFICANIYGLLHVCQVQTTIFRQQTVYRVLLTDNRWYEVNRCTAQKAIVGRPFKKRANSVTCF
jgi:hypothetical protein